MGLQTLPPHVIEYSPDFSEDVFEDKQEQFTNNVPNLAISEINRIVRITNFKVVCVQALTITCERSALSLMVLQNHNIHI